MPGQRNRTTEIQGRGASSLTLLLNINQGGAGRGPAPLSAPKVQRPWSGTNLRLAYEHPDLGDDPQEDPAAAADMALTARVADVIHRHYPDHFWKIEVSHQAGIVMISIPALMNSHAYILHIAKLDLRLQRVVNAAGEILERYRIPRSGLRLGGDEFLAAFKANPLGYRRGKPPS